MLLNLKIIQEKNLKPQEKEIIIIVYSTKRTTLKIDISVLTEADKIYFIIIEEGNVVYGLEEEDLKL